MTKSAGNCWFDHIYWRILNGKLRFLCVDNKIKNIFKLGISWLYVIIVSSTSFRVNPHSIVCLNVTELLARSRHHIWSLSDSNEIRTRNHLVRKRTRIDVQYLSVLCPNAGKYGPEKLRIRHFSRSVLEISFFSNKRSNQLNVSLG